MLINQACLEASGARSELVLSHESLDVSTLRQPGAPALMSIEVVPAVAVPWAVIRRRAGECVAAVTIQLEIPFSLDRCEEKGSRRREKYGTALTWPPEMLHIAIS
jgi:hypothetical protein